MAGLSGGKKGGKRHILVDGRGVLPSIVVTGANRHDATQLEVVLDEIRICRPDDTLRHLCADKGYANRIKSCDSQWREPGWSYAARSGSTRWTASGGGGQIRDVGNAARKGLQIRSREKSKSRIRMIHRLSHPSQAEPRHTPARDGSDMAQDPGVDKPSHGV
ncbi:MAG: transposase [Desulfobacteraceae bacterium]|nr:transposase [Desulfobacteraceae bacterium]